MTPTTHTTPAHRENENVSSVSAVNKQNNRTLTQTSDVVFKKDFGYIDGDTLDISNEGMKAYEENKTAGSGTITGTDESSENETYTESDLYDMIEIELIKLLNKGDITYNQYTQEIARRTEE